MQLFTEIRSSTLQSFSNVLVGVDISATDPSTGVQITAADEAALNCSIVVCRAAHANLKIFSSLDPYPYLHDALKVELDQSHIEKEAKKILGHFQARAADGGVESRAKVGFGSPWEEICREVLSEKHDLVVAGTRNLSRAGRFLFGSTGIKLLRNCPCSVWITRPGTDWRRPRVLVPSDLGDVSLEALRAAVALGEIVDAQIHVLHALDERSAPPLWYGRQAQEVFKDFSGERRSDAKRQLEQQLIRAECDRLPDDVGIHVARGRPDEAILRNRGSPNRPGRDGDFGPLRLTGIDDGQHNRTACFANAMFVARRKAPRLRMPDRGTQKSRVKLERLVDCCRKKRQSLWRSRQLPNLTLRPWQFRDRLRGPSHAAESLIACGPRQCEEIHRKIAATAWREGTWS